jgi:hypothetical protein
MITKITKHYSIQTNSCNCHPETCSHWGFDLLKDGIIIDSDDYIPMLQFPNDNVRFKVLDFYGYQNHHSSKTYKRWKRNRK